MRQGEGEATNLCSRDEENKDVWSCSLAFIDGFETHDLCCYVATKKEAEQAAALELLTLPIKRGV